MNRNEEYSALLRELEDTPPALEKALPRARARLRRRRVLQPAASLAGLACCFVLLVNFCAPVAYACSRVPLLRELAAAVTFSPSLSRAVDNEYVQPLELTQTQCGITAQVEYLIVDQKQVNIFYRLDTESGGQLREEPRILSLDGSSPGPCSYGLNSWDVPNGQLRSMTVDFVAEDVPDTLLLELDVWQDPEEDAPALTEEGPADQQVGDEAWLELPPDPEPLTTFRFELHFDPTFTASGRQIELGEPLTLDGQTFTFTQLEIYPTHLRLDLEESEENTAWLTQLYFTVEGGGQVYQPVSNGVTATGSGETHTMTSYRAESPYFEKADSLTIRVTGAEWLDKAHERTLVDLAGGKADFLPEGVSFYAAKQVGSGWKVSFLARQRKENHVHQIFRTEYYDPEGNQMEYHSWSSGGLPLDAPDDSFLVTLYLEDYPYDQVWLCPQYSRQWQAPESICFTVDLTQ